jgi:hypothetical protein
MTTPRVAMVLHVDRHSDPGVFAFDRADAAIEWAKARAREFDRFDDLDETLTPEMRRSGWLYFARYGEGNSLRVESIELHGVGVVADYEIVDENDPIVVTPEQKARASIERIGDVAQRVASAMNRVAWLEDQRALVKANAIRRLVEEGKASSVTAAERIVESDDQYAAHRLEQRDAEIDKWAALGAWEAMRLDARLDVAIATNAMRGGE